VKKILRVLIVFFALIFIAFIGWSILELRSIEQSIQASGKKASRGRMVFRFAVLIPSINRDLFYIRAYNGMKEIADAEQAALQLFEYQREEGIYSIREKLRLIMNTNPDGIILSIPYDPSYEESINAMVEKKIPVVTLENDFASSNRNAYVGTNTFELGRLAGQAVSRSVPANTPAGAPASAPENREIGVLLSGGGDPRSVQNSSFMQGFRQILRDFNDINIGLIRSYEDTTLAGEEFIREILVSHNDISIAVFTGPQEAEGAANALIEFGRVGAPLIIAADDNPEIRKLMEMGVISATVVRQPENAGRAAMEALFALARSERTNAYVDPGAAILWAEDLMWVRRP
jgi:ribose transport system substrate-binding protein